MRLRWLASLLLWFLLTTSVVAFGGLAGQENTEIHTAASLPGDRAVYRSALVVVEGEAAHWFDLHARYAFERVPDRMVPGLDGVAASFVQEWAVEPFEFRLRDFLFMDFPDCVQDLTGTNVAGLPGSEPDWAGMSDDDWDAWEADLDACMEDVDAWTEDVEAWADFEADRLDAWDDETHEVQASDWHVSHVVGGDVVASSLRGADLASLMPQLPQATVWTVPQPSEAPCGFAHGLQQGQGLWAPLVVHGACPPSMDFGFAATGPLPGPVRLEVSGQDRVGDWPTTVYSHMEDPDLLRLWFADEVPYPVRILSHVDVVPPAWIPYANNGHPPSFYILQELIESEPGAPMDPVAPLLPNPVGGRRAVWGPSDAGVDHPWPLSLAFLQAARAPDSALGDWLLNHPDGAVDSARPDGTGWSFTVVEGGEGLQVAVYQDDGIQVTATPIDATGRPDGTQQPRDVPGIRGLAQQAARWGVPTSAWQYDAVCGATCDDVSIYIGLGQQPSWGDGATAILIFDDEGHVVGQASHPSPYPAPRFADGAWQPAAQDAWSWSSVQSGTWTWPEPKTTATVAAGAGLLSLLYFLWPALKGAGTLPLFSRIRSQDLLEHPVRSDLYDAVRQRPGIHFQELVRTLEKGRGTTEHHVRKLVAAGLLVEKAERGFTCYFPKGTVDRHLMAAAPALKARGAQDVLRAVHADPGTVAARISDRLDMPTSTVNYHLKRLVDAGLVDGQRQGRTLILRATALGDQALGTLLS